MSQKIPAIERLYWWIPLLRRDVETSNVLNLNRTEWFLVNVPPPLPPTPNVPGICQAIVFSHPSS